MTREPGTVSLSPGSYPPAATGAARRPGPSLLISLLVLGLGVVLAAVGLALGVAAVVSDVTSPSYATPATFDRHLGTGDYDVFVAVPNLIGTIGTHVSVTDQDGNQLTVLALDSTESLDRGDLSYQDELRFHVDRAGTYRIAIGPLGNRAIVTRSLRDTARRAVGWFAMLGVGALVAVLGVILLIVGVSRRRRANRPPPGPPGPPPGWYPDHAQPGISRWWDGLQWTPHTHPSG